VNKQIRNILDETEKQIKEAMSRFVGEKDTTSENLENLKTLALSTLMQFKECPANLRQHVECIVGLVEGSHKFAVGYRGLTEDGKEFLNWIEEQKKI